MRVDTSLLQGIAAANQASVTSQPSSLKSTGTTTSFSSALKSAEKETTKPVEGQKYAEILTGPRAGMYVNTGGGARDGQAFILVKLDGREEHIYGTGKDRKVISTGGSGSSDKSSASDETASADKAPSGEKTKPVTGHRYADILNGPRSGLYLNTSGNVRDGQTFALVKRDGREFHIYGTGKDRTIMCLKPKTDTEPPKTAPPTGTSDPAPATGTTDSTTTGTTSPGTIVTDITE